MSSKFFIKITLVSTLKSLIKITVNHRQTSTLVSAGHNIPSVFWVDVLISEHRIIYIQTCIKILRIWNPFDNHERNKNMWYMVLQWPWKGLYIYIKTCIKIISLAGVWIQDLPWIPVYSRWHTNGPPFFGLDNQLCVALDLSMKMCWLLGVRLLKNKLYLKKIVIHAWTFIMSSQN